MQKTKSIHQIILEIHLILESHDLKDYAHQKIIEVTFSFPKLYQYAKNQLNSSIQS